MTENKVPVTFKMSADLVARLDVVAAANGVSKVSLVEEALERHLDFLVTREAMHNVYLQGCQEQARHLHHELLYVEGPRDSLTASQVLDQAADRLGGQFLEPAESRRAARAYGFKDESGATTFEFLARFYSTVVRRHQTLVVVG